MGIPAILQGEPHLPLKESTTSDEAIELSNAFYQTELDPKDFKPSQAFWCGRGTLTLELIDKESGEVVVTFKNKSSNGGNEESPPETEEENWDLTNPILEGDDKTPFLYPPIKLMFPKELEFLDELGKGPVLYPTTGNDNNLSYKLAQLVNSYGQAGYWVSGTMGVNCMGGFELIFNGESKEAPEEFSVPSSDKIVIIKTHHGESIGYLCLLT